MTELENLRQQIDAADDKIVAALNYRFALTRQVRALKAREGIARVDLERERKIIERMVAMAPADEVDTVAAVYERILGGSRGFIETIARGVCVQDGQVLLCRAKGGSSTYLPGGHIEFGETGAEALVREVREELGVESSAGKLLGVVENTFLQHGKRHAEINLVYRLELKEPLTEPKAMEDWIEFEWCSMGALDAANLLPERMRTLCSM